MSISFAESVQMAANAASKTAKSTQLLASSANDLDMNSMVSTASAYDLDELGMVGPADTLDDGETWLMVTGMGYEFYNEYHDDEYSTVDSEKRITLNNKQINITQETNSQYIPFKMERYYDGFDLATAKLQVYFVNREGYYGIDYPVDVYVSGTKIKFAWLVDSNVTMLDGRVSFEIQAIGKNSKGETYIWKTRPNEQMNIIASLTGSKFIEPDDTWQEDFLSRVNTQAALAQSSADDARASAASADASVQEAARYAEDAKKAAEDLQNGIVEEVQTAVEEQVSSVIETEINAALENYYTRTETDNAIAGIDGLANFGVEYDGSTMTFYNGESVMDEVSITSDPSQEWTTTYSAVVDQKIEDAVTPVQNSLDAYKSATDSDLQGLHDSIDGLPETLSTDYYTKVDTDKTFATKSELNSLSSTVDTVNSTANTNKSNITTLGEKVATLESSIGSVDTSPRLVYDATYDSEYTFTLWEQEGDDESTRTAKSQFKIQGGSGTGTSSVLKIEYITKTPIVATLSDDVIIRYAFSGTDSSGDAVLEGNAVWKVNGTVVGSQTATAGENEFNITSYLTLGTQKVNLTITDDAGSLVTKNWTVQKIDVHLESTFNDTITYPVGPVTFDYTPYGAVSKTIYFVLDGKELGTVTTSASGIPTAYTIPEQSHGAHLLDVYMTAEVNGNDIESNHITKDILWYDESSDMPVIGTVYQEFTARQHDATNITYTVYDPTTETPTVTIAVDGDVVSTRTLTSATNVYPFKSADVGSHIITITCGSAVKALTAVVEKLDIDIAPVTAGLVFDFNPTGKSNDDADRLWSNESVAMTVSDNFDWVNGGYQIDSNGDQYFCIKAGTSATIDYRLFADDAKKNGKEMKLVFKTDNVAKADATFLRCVDNTTGDNDIGIVMKAHEASIYGQAESLQLPYSEGDIIEFEFNISKNTEDVPIVSGYEDGVSTRHLVYDDSHSFTQNTPKVISLGSEYCDLHIYRFKVYNTSLTARGILNNFIADARNAEEMIARYDRNQIYDENGQLDPDVLATKCPWLIVYKISAPYFTNNKSDKVPGTTIQQIYKNGDPVLDNWTCYNAMHSGQGTSSNNYGAAGRNLDFIMNKSGVDGVDPYFVMGDGSRATEITMTRTSVPVAYLNAKVNIASSNNMTNAMLANRYNQFNPYKRQFVRDEGVDTSFIKDTMQFSNCVIFIQETNEDLSTHREFADRAYHFYAIGNIGDSKKTDKTRLTDPTDKYECIIEVMDVELPLSDFPADTMMNAMGYTVDKVTNEKIYTWAKDENLGILYELVDGEYVLTEDETVDLNKTYYVDILEHDDFSEDYTYGWRYVYKDGTDEENAEAANYCHQKWIEFYRFITTSTDEEFKDNLGNYCVLDSVIYYYLFTTRYCMVDNRSKNLFFHYGKTGEVDESGNPIRKWDLSFDYDNDRNYVVVKPFLIYGENPEAGNAKEDYLLIAFND